MRLVIAMLMVLMSFNGFGAVEVGVVSYSRGLLTGQVEGDFVRIIGKGSPVHNNEVLTTGRRGLAVIKLDDGTKMTLRPSTTFKIEDVNTRQGEENVFLRLLRGGFRALTGLISKRNPNAFNIGTSVATIGIRGTEFDLRLCEAKECDEENRATGKQAENESRVVGRVAILNGRASATDQDRTTRILTLGAALYERDQIQTGINSYIVVAFNDKSRVTLSPNSVFRIEEHEFKPDLPDENNSFLRFLKGGFRFVTGAIARLNQKAVRIATPTATIGIRGTGFDLICEGECVSNNASLDVIRKTTVSKLLNYFLKPVYALGDGNGMYVKVWKGAIEFQLGNARHVLQSGSAAYLRNSFSRPQSIPDIPLNIRNMGGAPRPDRVKINIDLFGGVEKSIIEPGLYINVREGDVTVRGIDGSRIFLGAGEAGVVGTSGRVERLKFVPPFQKFDRVPNPRLITERMEKMIDFFGQQGADKQELECTIR